MMQLIWKGEPIVDLETWCRTHGCDLVRFRYERYEINPFSGVIETVCVEEGVMPTLFQRCMREGDGEKYVWLDIIKIPPAD